MDFEKLLKKYIRYVGESEGTDFILTCDSRYKSETKFSENEWMYLEALANKIDSENT